MSKKILSVVLALVLVMTTFAVSAFAVGGTGYEDDSTKTQTWALENKRDNGDGTWSVDVRLTANYVVGAISFQVTNPDAEDGKLVGATLTSVTKGAALTYGANIQKNSTTGLVVIIPEPATEAEKGVDLTSGGIVATLTFTLTAESADIAIINDPKTETNRGGDLIAVRLSDENLTTATWIYGQTVTSVGSTETLGAAAAAPELAVIDGTAGVIDTERTVIDEIAGTECTGYIYGLNPDLHSEVGEVFEVVGDGTMEVIANEAGYEMASGAMVNVLDLDENVVATYVVIIFGDVNGDGVADLSDASDIESHDGGMYGLDPETGDDIFGFGGLLPTYATFAGDVTVDGSTDLSDASDIESHDGGMYGLDPESGEDIFGCGGRITPEYIIGQL